MSDIDAHELYLDAVRALLGADDYKTAYAMYPIPDGLDRRRKHHEQEVTEPSCAWALHVNRVLLGITPRTKESAASVLARIDDAAAEFFTDEGIWGFRFASEIANKAGERFRTNTGNDHPGRDLPAPLTLADVARESDLSIQEVVQAIVRARWEAFGTRSYRQICRLQPPEQRLCQDCGEPLPLGAPKRQRYCEACSTPAAYTSRSRSRRASTA